MILPKHVFEPFMGAKSRENPANLKPVGTGPYKFVDFKPGDMLRAEANKLPRAQPALLRRARDQGRRRRHSAPRAPCCRPASTTTPGTWQVEDEILKRLEASGKGKISSSTPAATSSSSCSTSPTPGTRSTASAASIKSKHPAFSDKAVRDAMSLLIDRKGVQDFIYGRGGIATANFLNNPPRFRSPTPSSSSTSTRPTRCWRPPAGRRAPTASAPRATSS
jgi:peptide/nickel transport system substrate-binding protein